MSASTITKLHQSSEDQTFAEALAQVTQMRAELLAARVEIGQLKSDLHKEETRVVLLVDDRDRFRCEANKFRTMLIELATKMTDIGLLTLKAQEVMQTVAEIDASPTLASEAVAKLDAEHRKGNVAAIA